MRLCPYLCGMKTIKLITLTAIFFCLNIPLYAQFNTVGTINNKRIYTTNPPKPKEALTDSIVVADSVPDSTTTDNDGDGQTIVTSSQTDHAQWHRPFRSIRKGLFDVSWYCHQSGTG